MRKHMVAAVATTSAFLAAMTGLAGPAAAADDEWVMPDVRGEVLDAAVSDVQSVVGDVELDLRFVPRDYNQQVYNLTNWAVCATSPRPEGEISQETKRVIFSLRRLNEEC
ncbi:hypothetical protein BST22_20140 [Mycolicibacterium chubuense]|uniref:PASTA domain-containing protein n=1 Tax=Mycolicibacterium chubuense TaxID=1800 RepID=A0A0J6WL46_MYCCU|nr:hypothetical protein [Mycolicibacterium chubuense]KMO83354.1 hypothetical protein MCHUDSM44219_01192 [Mycolicibacterium chubuense]ORA47671.1 hypothetical protein BST22_20140 [Mycolicibacterium chubuense]SPY00392.1 Uncharacterised protein [Mycolicibacterium chubuense]